MSGREATGRIGGWSRGQDNALFTLDPEEAIRMWPEVAQYLYGYGEDDAVGRPLDLLFADTDRSPGFVGVLADAKGGTIEIEAVLGTAREGTLPESAAREYESIPWAMADETRLAQLFENLLRNSVDHGGRTVTVRVGPLEDGFYVEDDGPGIRPRTASACSSTGSRPERVAGYGLSVVRSIVGAHG